ncbi:hypothetical protein J437_LFUL001135 [Ladona fulva]|uniref:acylaminoacyl-peptidase n=1 Tax=Ladona fulva TaxID=123851 RepID=A0A8K0NW89_LADFU|nr:hypothetical protein J437_LFUL001135 [Ladona fulva]
MNAWIEKVVNVYRKAAQYPAALKAKICKKDGSFIVIVSDWSQRNLERGKMTNFRRVHLLDKDTLNLIQNLPPVDVTNEICSRVSESEKWQAVFRDASADGSKTESSKKIFLEVWKHGQLWKNLDLSALNVHGEVYADGTFGCIEWSPCERRVLYIAEKKRPKAAPFYSVKPIPEKPTEENDDNKPVQGSEYDFIEDWGEQLTGKSQPVLAVYDVEKDAPVIWEEGLPEGYCPGQATWIPNLQPVLGTASGDMDVEEDAEGVVGIAWKSEPRRLGLIFCTNREGILFHANSAGKIRVLRGLSGGISPRSPRFSPDGSQLVWLERLSGGTHDGSMRLMHCAWPPPFDGPIEGEVLIDFDTRNLSDGNEKFRGIFCQALPRRLFTKDNLHLILNSQQETSMHPYLVDIEKKTVERIAITLNGKELEFERSSLVVLDVVDDLIVCRHSRLGKPHSLLVARLDGRVASAISSPSVPEDIIKLHTEIFHLTGNESEDPFTAIYYGPTDVKQLPLIVMPHGGPHSSFACEYSATTTMFGLLGFGMLMVNYRGSTGEWEQTLKTLPGKIGKVDVEDVRKATSEALKALPFLNPADIYLFGGSHGGYLVTLLSGLYPNDYRAVVTRNPVIDVASMCTSSDIPDWCTVESGVGEWHGDGKQSIHGDLEALSHMRKISPLVHASAVKAPTMIMIGKKDFRVPPAQGLLYYRCLKSCGVKTRLLVYDDCHSLSKVPNELDNLINAALWFIEHHLSGNVKS